MKTLSLVSLILSLLTIIFYFQPFQKSQLPVSLQFLKNSNFTPLGVQLDLAIFLGFFVVTQVVQLIIASKHLNLNKKAMGDLVVLGINIIALILTVYSLLKGAFPSVPPYRLSWYAAVETLKSPMTALFGVGIDNFASIFSKVRDVAFNQSSQWQTNTFNLSHSALLQILTEAGILGLISFLLLSAIFIKETLSNNKFILLPVIYLVLTFLFLPTSLPLFFLFFVLLSSVDEGKNTKSEIVDINFSDSSPGFVIGLILMILFVGISFYLLARSYVAEYYFKQSINAIVSNNVRDLYDNQRQSIMTNPFIERYRINFSQTNLLIANNLAQKSSTPSNEDRQTIAQAIQSAIAEAKAAVTLNEDKASNWENLAIIYRNLLSVAQGADSWTVSSYQRAIVLDPQNPQYRLGLGGVYYSLGNYDEALRFFEQATLLKPDWPNAYYNFAWAYYQKGQYQNAVQQMQVVTSLLNPNKDKADFDRAQNDLSQFKSKIPTTEVTPTPTPEVPPKQLTLPTPPTATFEPKLKLPEGASPEAK